MSALDDLTKAHARYLAAKLPPDSANVDLHEVHEELPLFGVDVNAIALQLRLKSPVDAALLPQLRRSLDEFRKLVGRAGAAEGRPFADHLDAAQAVLDAAAAVTRPAAPAAAKAPAPSPAKSAAKR